MRILFIGLTILLVAAFLGFVFTNLESRVDVRVWSTDFPGVPLAAVVFVAMIVGIVYLGIIAVGQGVQLALTNRKQTREIQKLEAELNYLRTQPPVSSRAEPDASAGPPKEPEPASGAYPGLDAGETAVPSAPVYGPEDDDDDVYSGGRAV